MSKKLTAKTQYLNPALSKDVVGFSKAITTEPETEEILLKKGVIYAVFTISGNSAFDQDLVTKVVQDVLHESYYQSDNISPIQSLEKAIVDVRDKVLQLANETVIHDEQSNSFSIIASVLWGNVLYVVQYGNALSYLMRAGEIRPINTVSEGAFSAASGVIKDEDVVIICSDEFGKKYPPDRLLSMAIGEQELQPEEACVLMRFIVDTSFTQNEAVDFGIENIAKKKVPNKVMANLFDKLKDASLIKKFGKKQKSNEEMALENVSIRLKSPEKIKSSFRFRPFMLAPIILGALALSIFFTLKNRGDDKTKDTTEPQSQVLSQDNVQETPEQQEEKDEEVFYDIKITDAQADPSNIAVFSSFVAVSDKSSGKIYFSDNATPKFTPIEGTFPGIGNLINIKASLGFTDNEGYKVWDLDKKEIIESYKQENMGVTAAYTDFVYSINESKITRYSKEDAALEGTLWGQADDFLNAKSMSIAYSIYVLTSQGSLVSHTSGTKDDFELKGEQSTLNDPVQVLADIDFENIYVADKGNKRVVVINDKGEFVKEYKAKVEDRWSDLKSIGVSPDEKTLFVLSGSRVYKVDL